jgi:hypothetical protein
MAGSLMQWWEKGHRLLWQYYLQMQKDKAARRAAKTKNSQLP